MYPNPTTPNPMPIEKKAMFSLNSVGLPVFLNPIYAKIPNARPTTSPSKLRAVSRTNSNYAHYHFEIN